MTKTELARKYFPDAAPHTALIRLMRWINRCQPLKAALAETGYTDRCRVLTCRQVALIQDYLGQP